MPNRCQLEVSLDAKVHGNAAEVSRDSENIVIGISFHRELKFGDRFDNWKQVLSKRYKFSNDVY